MTIEFDEAKEQFLVPCKEGHQATLRFRKVDSNTVDFYSTFVPEQCRGTGAGLKLVKHGLAWAKSQELDVVASCWFVEKVMASKRQHS